eukprot:6636946-Pyramimonas_sp.AAC.1
MGDALRRGARAPRCDPGFVAGKKLTKRAMKQRENELDDATMAMAKAKAKTKRHSGASGAKLAAAGAAGAGSSAAGQVIQRTPSGVELPSPPTTANWNDRNLKMMVCGSALGLA